MIIMGAIFDLLTIFVILIIVSTVLIKKKILTSFVFFSENKLDNKSTLILYVSSFLLFLFVWDLLSSLEPTGINKIPNPLNVLIASYHLLISGTLLSEAWYSISRTIIGFSAATIVGVSIGLLAGSFILFKNLIIPINSFLRYIPPTAFISLLIVYLGIGELYKYSVIFLGVIFFIIQMVIDIIDDIDKQYFEMAFTMELSKMKIFQEIILPSSLPRILDVLRINLGAAWTFLVAAEIVGADKGLGHLIAVSQRYLRIENLFVGILSFGIIGIITDKLLDVFSRKVFRWYYISIKR